jgi:hypothetical protein
VELRILVAAQPFTVDRGIPAGADASTVAVHAFTVAVRAFTVAVHRFTVAVHALVPEASAFPHSGRASLK